METTIKTNTKQEPFQADQAAAQPSVIETPPTKDHDWPSKIFWATLCIGGGLLLIAINLGYLPWPDWKYLWRLWPILLIFIGLNIFLDKQKVGKWLMTALSLLVIFGSLAYAMLMTDAQLYRQARSVAPWLPVAESADSQSQDRQSFKSQQVIDNKSEYSQAASRIINLNMGLGSVELQSADIDRQIEIYSQGEASNSHVSSRVNINNDKVVVDVDIDSKAWGILNFGRDDKYIMDIGQTQQSTDLNVDLGAGNATIDLQRRFNLSGGVWQVGAGNLTAKLGSQSLPSGLLKLDVGVGKMIVYVPANIDLEIKHKVGLGNLEVFGNKLQQEGTYQADSNQSSQTKITLEVEVGVGSLIITQL